MVRRRSLLLVAAFFPALARAYPIPPVPLRKLVESSDLIVVARVTAVTRDAPQETEGQEPSWDNDIAHLAVVETLKGSRPEPLEVRFTRGLICPAPPRYEPGETVLAFLRSGDRLAREWSSAPGADEGEIARADKMRGRWYTNSLSYGTLYPTSDELKEYRAAIREAAALDPKDEKAVRGWLLRAAERRATRWDALYELAATSDTMHSFYDPGAKKTAIAPLTRAEKERLADAFVRDPSLDVTLPMMLTILADLDDRSDVDLIAAAAVETLLARKEPPYVLVETIPLVVARFHGCAAPKTLAAGGADATDDAEDLDVELSKDPLIARANDRTTADDVRRDWQRLKEELKIPTVAPLRDASAQHSGVGATTPP